MVSAVIMMGNGEILGILYWLLRNMDYLCTAHGVVHIRIGWHRLVPDHPFFIPKIRFSNNSNYHTTYYVYSKIHHCNI